MIPGAASHVARHRRGLAEFFAQQRDAVGTGSLDEDEWNPVLAAVVISLAKPTIQVFGAEVAGRLGGVFDLARLDAYLDEYGRITAEWANTTTFQQLADADDAAAVWAKAITVRAPQMAVSKVTTEANLGRHEAAAQNDAGEKRWVVTSNNPRPSHARMSGESVPIDSEFSNGARWPGDPVLSVDERAGCSCMLEFG